MNPVEVLLSTSRQAIRRGNFASLGNLIAAIRRFVHGWNERCRSYLVRTLVLTLTGGWLSGPHAREGGRPVPIPSGRGFQSRRSAGRRGFIVRGPFTVADLRTGEQTEVQTLPWKAEKQGASEPPSGRLWSVTSSSGLGASVAFDGTVTLWDVERRQALGTVRVPGAFDFSDLTFDPQGRRLAVATAGGAMSLVQVTPDVWRTRACTLAARDFTVEERRLHLSGQEVPPACP